jgi:hypothetical protein
MYRQKKAALAIAVGIVAITNLFIEYICNKPIQYQNNTTINRTVDPKTFQNMDSPRPEYTKVDTIRNKMPTIDTTHYQK